MIKGMDPYAKATNMQPADGCKFIVMSYTLAKKPFPDPENPNHVCMGAMIGFRGFNIRESAIAYRDHLSKTLCLDNITVVTACEWFFISTMMHRDQSTHRPRGMDRFLMNQNKESMDEISITSRLRSHDEERAYLEKLDNGKLVQLAYAVQCEEEDVATLKSLLSHHQGRMKTAGMALEEEVCGSKDPHGTLNELEADVRGIVGDEAWLRIKTKVASVAGPMLAQQASRSIILSEPAQNADYENGRFPYQINPAYEVLEMPQNSHPDKATPMKKMRAAQAVDEPTHTNLPVTSVPLHYTTPFSLHPLAAQEPTFPALDAQLSPVTVPVSSRGETLTLEDLLKE
jgi:hypothetical protein